MSRSQFVQPLARRELGVREDLKELASRGTPLFPLAVYNDNLDFYVTGDVPLHWHEEVEIVVVQQGSVSVKCQGEEQVLRTGDGIFIAGSLLHSIHRHGQGRCRIFSLVFHHSILSGDSRSVFEQVYVQPLATCDHTILLRQSVPWEKLALDHITAAWMAAAAGGFGYELTVRANLSLAWRLLVERRRDLLHSRPRDSVARQRMRRMLDFIQANYDQPIGVAEIARSASISESECYRCFKALTRASPVLYLTRYRLRVAAALLTTTEQSVTDIALAVGFHSPSYFASTFRRMVGVTPRAWRESGGGRPGGAAS